MTSCPSCIHYDVCIANQRPFRLSLSVPDCSLYFGTCESCSYGRDSHQDYMFCTEYSIPKLKSGHCDRWCPQKGPNNAK